MALTPAVDRYAALRVSEFRAYVSFKFLMTFGLQMQAVVMGIYIYKLTGNPLNLGLVGLTEAAPALISALYGGHLADRSDKRLLLGWVSLAMGLCAAIIWAGALGVQQGLLATPQYLILLYTMVFCGGVARGFYSPAGFSLMGLLVPRELYANSSSWNSVVWQLATVCGPALGGFLYAWGGPGLAFGVAAACIFIARLLLAGIRPRPILPTAVLSQEGLLASIREGWRFVFSQRLLLGAISLDLFSVFFGGVVALLPVYADDILRVGPQGLGFLRAADAMGSVCTMWVLTRFPPTGRPWRNLLIAVAVFGLSIIGFAASKSFYLSMAMLFVLGAADSVSVVIRSWLMQTLTPEHMRGRVSSVSSIFVASSNEVGAFESGVSARLMGTVPATYFGGIITLAIVTVTGLLTRKDISASHLDATTPTQVAEAQPSPVL